ncbi:hypothetical protein [Candidatus Endomicrobiellum agilis]|uniref:hypothetical protein n=1 Tax=Candidatus Endomicrobiellum agilis TaxID=3238957 RepID=UPI00358B2A40|nr:hypothetical protein [Endomicrobium sp.]
MKKIISVCLCICLMSGCGKPFRHGRPVNTAVEDKGSEGVPTHSLTSDTSNASAPTPEPSKSALPASGNVDTGSSVGKIVLCVVALAVITCVVIYRRVSPEIFRDVNVVPKAKYVDILVNTSEQLESQGYKRCYYGYSSSTSYFWRFFKKVKKTICHWSYFDFETRLPIEGMPDFLCEACLSPGFPLYYKPKPKPEPAPNQ